MRKQLKKQFPDRKRLPKKDKKELARKVLAEVVAEYDFKHKNQQTAGRVGGSMKPPPKGEFEPEKLPVSFSFPDLDV